MSVFKPDALFLSFILLWPKCFCVCLFVCVCVCLRQIHAPCFYLNIKIRTNMVLLCVNRCSLHSACGSATAMDSECGTWTSILFDV